MGWGGGGGGGGGEFERGWNNLRSSIFFSREVEPDVRDVV